MIPTLFQKSICFWDKRKKRMKVLMQSSMNPMPKNWFPIALLQVCFSNCLFTIKQRHPLLEHAIKSTKRTLNKHKLMTDAEKVVFKYLNALLKAPDAASKNKLLQKMADELAPISSEETWSGEYRSWHWRKYAIPRPAKVMREIYKDAMQKNASGK